MAAVSSAIKTQVVNLSLGLVAAAVAASTEWLLQEWGWRNTSHD